MKLQLALDRLSRKDCAAIAAETRHDIDIIEIGTGVIKQYGVGIIAEVKQASGGLPVLADMKTCDAGLYETRQALEAGAAYTTVMAFADEKTVADSLREAERLGGAVMVDLLGVHDETTIRRLYTLGVRLFAAHIGKDKQGDSAAEQQTRRTTEWLRDLDGAGFAFAGGVNEETVAATARLRPDIIIVGSAISAAPSPQAAARLIRRKMDEANETFA